jgi:alanine dehydrogenase
MKIGIPYEENIYENRVSMTPPAVNILRKRSHEIFVTVDAGLKSGYSNDEYKKAGATIVQSNKETYAKSDIIVKVNAPMGEEIEYLREGQIVFGFLNLITDHDLTEKLSKKKITAIAYELIKKEKSTPIVESMSRIAGKLSFSIGSEILSKPNAGKGVLLGGSPSASRSKIVVIGAGNAGMELVRIALHAGSRVSVFDNVIEKLNIISHEFPSVETFYPYHELLIKQLSNADLVLGATSTMKKKTVKLISNEMLKMMEPRSVLIDLTTPCGGISESSKVTELGKPIYLYNEIFHYCVHNIAASVPKTASNALSTNILPFLLKVTEGYLNDSPDLLDAICINNGKVAEYLEIKEPMIKQKMIETLINDDDDDDVINWQQLNDKKDFK